MWYSGWFFTDYLPSYEVGLDAARKTKRKFCCPLASKSKCHVTSEESMSGLSFRAERASITEGVKDGAGLRGASTSTSTSASASESSDLAEKVAEGAAETKAETKAEEKGDKAAAKSVWM